MQIFGDGTPQNWDTDSPKRENHCLDWGGVFSGQSERRRVLVVKFVDLLVERWCVQGTVEPIMPCVLENEENGDLVGHREDRREGNGGR